MYIKTMAGLLIVVSCYLIGERISFQYMRRTQLLTQFRVAFHQLESYVVYKALPMTESFQALGNEPSMSGHFFAACGADLSELSYSSLYEVWNKNVCTVLAETALQDTDLAVIDDFGKTLGVMGRENHKDYFSLLFMQLDEQIGDAA